MSQALTNLLALLNLEKIEEGLFRGQSETSAYVRSSAARWLVRRCMPPKKPCLRNA